MTAKTKPAAAILVDLDGTLVDSRSDLARALNRTLEHYGAPPLSVDVVTDLIGEGALRLVEKAFPENLGGKVDDVLERFLDEYARGLVIETKPYPGIPEVLRALSAEYPVAVVTNKREQLSVEVCDRLGLLQYISLVVGPDTAGDRKPSPKPLIHALERLGVGDPARSFMIGDSSFDVIAGKAAGLRTVGVTWGYRPAEELGEAELLMHRPEDLTALLALSP